MPSVLQPWVTQLPFMQQTVLLSAIRGPDGRSKYDSPKMLLRWYRRSILISSLNGMHYADPLTPGGGSFTGPSFTEEQVVAFKNKKNHTGDYLSFWLEMMEQLVDDYFIHCDAFPSHFQNHFMHGAEVIGYKHPHSGIRQFWGSFYKRLCNDLHLYPESEGEMDFRLGDNEENWRARNEKATQV